MAASRLGCHADCGALTGGAGRSVAAPSVFPLNFVSTIGPITGMFPRMPLTAIMTIIFAGSEQARGAAALMLAYGDSKDIQDAPAYL